MSCRNVDKYNIWLRVGDAVYVGENKIEAEVLEIDLNNREALVAISMPLQVTWIPYTELHLESL